MDSSPSNVEFQFSQLKLENCMANVGNPENWQLLLGIVADFSIRLDGKIFYEEFDFTVVEFAASAKKWLRKGGDLEFTSMESEFEPLLAFYRRPDGNLMPYSAHASFATDCFVESAALMKVLAQFIELLKKSVQDELGIRIDQVFDLKRPWWRRW